MVNFGKVGKYFKKSVLVLLAASVGYYAGIKQKPDFQKFPSSVQQTIKVEHDTLQLELKESITLFSQGKFQEAIKRFEAAKAVAKSMAKIDPRYKELGKRIDSFEMFIRGLEMMTKYVDSEIKKGFKMISIPPTEMDLQYISIQGTNPTMNAIYLNKLIQSGTFKDDRELEDAAKNTMILLLEEERENRDRPPRL